MRGTGLSSRLCAYSHDLLTRWSCVYRELVWRGHAIYSHAALARTLVRAPVARHKSSDDLVRGRASIAGRGRGCPHEDSSDARVGILLLCSFLLSMAGDVLVGWLVCKHVASPDGIDMVQYAVDWTDVLATRLDDALTQLMASPTEYHLHARATDLVGRLFRHFISLWGLYLEATRPVYPFLAGLVFNQLNMILGISLMVSVCRDLFTLMTLHLYYFYVYASFIYALLLKGLSALSQLFRARRINPLRKRVDNHEYDAEEIVLGTTFFTIAIFCMFGDTMSQVAHATAPPPLYSKHTHTHMRARTHTRTCARTRAPLSLTHIRLRTANVNELCVTPSAGL